MNSRFVPITYYSQHHIPFVFVIISFDLLYHFLVLEVLLFSSHPGVHLLMNQLFSSLMSPDLSRAPSVSSIEQYEPAFAEQVG